MCSDWDQTCRVSEVQARYANNWPPLPKRCCIRPCFYQDIVVDIVPQYRIMVKLIYYLWIFYVITLFYNVIGALAFIIVYKGGNDADIILFVVAICNFLLWSPISFLCWYRSAYKAFRGDRNSLHFTTFFICFIFHILKNLGFTVGFVYMGACGFYISYIGLTWNMAAGAVMMIASIMLALEVIASIVILFLVGKIYISTDNARWEYIQTAHFEGHPKNTLAILPYMHVL